MKLSLLWTNVISSSQVPPTSSGPLCFLCCGTLGAKRSTNNTITLVLHMALSHQEWNNNYVRM